MARAEAATLAAEAQANAAEAQQQRETAQAASTAAITEQEIALAERNSALEARGTAQAASTLAIQQQEMAEAERNSAVEARATLVAYLEQLLATEEPTPTPTATPLPTGTPVEFSIAADATATPTPTTIPTPTVDRGATATVLANAEAQLAEVKATQTAVALAETMVQVPAGTFLMGSLPDSSGLPGLDRNPEPEPDEFPQRAVFLPTFWIDRTEVTNADYRACVEAAVCARQSGGDPNYHNLPRFDKYPALFVSWQDAQTYCRWLGKRLPGEAEWEKAARGDDGRIWPWGNALQDNFAFPVQRANVGDSGIGSITETGNFPNGASPYGALDMSGNVWEWTNDWYKFTYYAERPDPDRSPPGPSEADSSGRKVIRGGSYLTVGIDSRTTERNAIAPDAAFDVGFRCAQD